MADKKLSIALTAVNQLARPFADATKSVGSLKSAAADTDQTLQGLGRQQGMITRFRGLSTQVEETRGKLGAARAELKRLQSGELAAGQSAAQHAAALRKAERQVAKLTTTYGRQSKELGGLRHDLTSAGLKVEALGAEELRLAKKTKQANTALEAQAGKLKRVQALQFRIDKRNGQKGELAGQAVGLVAQVLPVAMAGKRAIEYESTFADVKKVVDFASPEEEAQYRSQMMKLAGELGVQQQGIAEIVTAAGQSGIEKDQLLAFADSATRMSVAWDVSAEEAGSTLATWRAAMGLTQENALDLADATNYLSNNMNAKAKDIAAVMVRQGSTAMGAGLNYNQTAALSASLIAGGATEDTAATALKNISGALTAGYSATGSQKEALGRLGFDPEMLAEAMQEDGQGTLLEVMRSLQEVSDAERGAVISELFGSEIKGAVSKLVTTLDDDKNGLVAAFGRVADEADRAGSVNDEYANRAKTRAHTLGQLSAKFDRMMIVLGDKLLPAVDAVVPPLMTVVDGVTAFAEANPKLASGLLGVAAAIAVVKAGAIAFKMAKLALGNGADRFRLGREQLTGSTDRTTQSANRASKALDRMNRKMASIGSGRGGGGYEGGSSGRSGRRRSSGRRLRGGGRWGRMAGLLGSGAALAMFSGTANAGDLAMAGADVADVAGGLSSALPAAGTLGKVGQAGGKVFKPLGIALQGAALTSAVADGDARAIGGTAGDMVGGLGGAAAGAMAGAALGSVVPIVGTALGGIIGSVVGGFGGGELGGWLGEQLGGWFAEDKTAQPAPDSVARQSQALAQVNRQIHFAPQINITPSGNPEYDRGVAQQLTDQLRQELSGVLLGDDVAVRADVGLTDRSVT